MSEILGWRCEDREFNCWLTDDGSDVESARLAGCRITPLVAAPPGDGRPTRIENALRKKIAEWRADPSHDANHGEVFDHACSLDWMCDEIEDLLSRIPKDTA